MTMKYFEHIFQMCLIQSRFVSISAINLLKEDSVVFKHKNLIYTFLPEFMSLAPKDTVLILKKLGHKIEPLSVLPYLIFPSNVLTDNEVFILLIET